MESILILIIIGIVSSVFGKAKGKHETTQAKPFTVKNFEDIRSILTNQRAEFEPNKQKEVQEEMLPQESYVQGFDNQSNRIEHETKSKLSGNSNSHSIRATRDSVHLQDESDEIFSNQADEKTLVNGIIWSEILGSPRSKSPFFAKKN